MKAGLQSREEEGGTWELYHSNILAKSTFFSKLHTATLNETYTNSIRKECVCPHLHSQLIDLQHGKRDKTCSMFVMSLHVCVSADAVKSAAVCCCLSQIFQKSRDTLHRHNRHRDTDTCPLCYLLSFIHSRDEQNKTCKTFRY